MIKHRLLTDKQRVLRHLTIYPFCFCCWDVENILYVMRDCYRAPMVWLSFNLSVIHEQFFELVSGWPLICKAILMLMDLTGQLYLICGTTYWFIWYLRNKGIFYENFTWPQCSSNIMFECVALIGRAKKMCFLLPIWTGGMSFCVDQTS